MTKRIFVPFAEVMSLHRFIAMLIGLSVLIVTAVACSEEESDSGYGVRTEQPRLQSSPQADTAEDDGVAMIDQLIACDPGVWDRDQLLVNLELDRRDTIEWVKYNLELFCGIDVLEKNVEPSPTPPPSSSGFSRDSLELLAAYQELLKFKDEPWFHTFCYGTASPANAWGEYVTKIGVQTFYETGVTGGDLWEMGWDYCQNQGRESDFTKQKRQEMKTRWLNHQPVPTPRSELRVEPDRP